MNSRARTCKRATNGHTPKAIALLVALREQDGHGHLLQETLIHENYTEPQTGLPPKARGGMSPKGLAAAQKLLHGKDVLAREDFALENYGRV